MKKRLFLFYLILILIAFLMGILLEYKRPIIYQNFLDIIKKNVRSFEIRNNYQEDLCNLPALPTLPNESNLIIGHMYGHPSVSEENPLGKIKDFISENRKNLKSVIFTGDIFRNPSYKKWLELKSFLNEVDINFHIAPGNHDVGIENGASRDLFKLVFDFKMPTQHLNSSPAALGLAVIIFFAFNGNVLFASAIKASIPSKNTVGKLCRISF